MTGGLEGYDEVAEANAQKSILDIHWSRICARLKAEVGEVEYNTWLRQMGVGPVDEDEITLYLPTRFLRDWVRGQYGDRLGALWHAEIPAIRRVELQVARGPSPAVDGDASAAESGAPSAATPPAMPVMDAVVVEEPRTAEVRSDLAAPLDPRFTFDTFVVGKPNEFAYACARRVAERPSSPGFNPLFLYGGVGLGKTHLMHAIGSELVREGRVSVAYMSAEKFMYRFIAAIRSQSTMEFKEQLRSVDVLMIDDLQFLIGKDNTQEEFFHTFNALVDAGRQIVVSADKSPSDLSGLEDRLRTRLGCGMVADIHATTFELRISILEAKATASGVEVPAKVLEFLAHKITSNVRELEGALNRLIAHANLFGRPVTLETTQDVLHDILKANNRRVTIEEIQRKVAEHWNIRLTDMSSARRSTVVARPRQVAMFLSKQLTSRSLPEIGRKFGNRDHTTVIYAVRRVMELMEQDPAFAEDVELLRRMLES
ncbi:chromosomal replication initiator protein DnaA [Novacetimonas hansenii]|uniref:Chromosomal replication initiator protein DnaA n=2 Tax=Novacetimonas hansenii TaxID=436 RepID=A0ABQ0SE50_NOVHA|nr:chromosomal replication initiator protein DnaA [Novacetimonas hansenii]EFG85067.1 chromosomal replication initiator protein DnaA [Novacetimonas hansenii ATCC 23769]GAN83668.1 chromosomal replication initiator protein DnaA [Novacetimonas hansenii JCM 7643]GBQ55547.1 chromosome replication initiator DnaA [Novacetimonas hansenii NRIC 0243]GEC63584.1 chromosomal replication initiator protein DnaA [Novacetimonas hansenii]